ncbi:putative terpene synthase family protein [Rosellinia necatrix]|uniref:Putative terpene synthase family protein n=1 Tax=Rosellinia necatrix TaxID=77044 RepID=A0A1W2TUR1_ROSNE|nr:putative terpene synthase family protein [Rosellinia necatrix]
MGDANSLAGDAKSLIGRALENYTDKYGLGAMSVAAYDTAWVAMVTKVVDGQKQWLFPECFEYVLSTQSEEGGWTIGWGAQIDGILNTAGPLLALKRHHAEPLQLQHDPQDLAARIEKATASLRSQLAAWDVSTTEHVGFEIIVPAMLELLEKEDPTLVFEFESKKLLMKINNAKLSRFRPEFLYGPRRFTALHSLESFIGKMDFDKVKHHRVHGSMLGSPSSTAAYMMHSSEWDDESEEYLRHVIKYAAGRGSGAVPSAFPSTHFEITWMLSTLLRGGYTHSDLEGPELTKMLDILSHSFEVEKGILGFAPFFEVDVDDTAKTILSLNMLGRPVSPKSLIDTFEAETHFRTYAGERDPSPTANCNALLALLHQKDVANYGTQIHKIAKYLVDFWWKADGKIVDKWNTCYLYPSVLIVEAFVDILNLIEQNKLPGVFDEDLQSRLAVALFQACLRPLLDQQENGSWNQSIEETAYGVLILGEARRVCFFQDLRQPLEQAIERGVAFIKSVDERPLNYIWIEKVSYASRLLTDSYVLAALKSASTTVSEATIGTSLWQNVSSASLDKHVKLFAKAELFSAHPDWELKGSMIEAVLLKPLLLKRRLEVFQRQGMQEDKYFDLIPLFWTSPNNRARTFASASFLYEVSLLSMLTYQVDEFMEAVAAPAFAGRLSELRDLIHTVLPEGEEEEEAAAPAAATKSQNGHANGNGSASAKDEVLATLQGFKKYCFENPYVKRASAADQKTLERELRTYLLSQTQQEDDSARFRARRDSGKPGNGSASTFYTWARSTGADNVSGPFAWAFIGCLLSATLTPGGGGKDVFPTAGEKYVAADVYRHLATMARIYNDLGSIRRDQEEGALNSVDFAEFRPHESVDSKKAVLHAIGEYEYDCLMLAFGKLEALRRQGAEAARDVTAARLSKRRMDVWSMFLDQVVLFDQIYVIKDLSSHHIVQENGNKN